MQSERKQEIAKAKLKKVRQQLNSETNPNSTQTGGNVPNNPSASPAPTPVTPPPTNVARIAQVGRPAKVPKPRGGQSAPVGGLKKAPAPKPPITRSKVKDQPPLRGVKVTEIEDNTATLVEVEYDTDELAELPTDSESEANGSELGEESAPVEEQ